MHRLEFLPPEMGLVPSLPAVEFFEDQLAQHLKGCRHYRTSYNVR
mgnify:CR=1 FL=1